MMTQMIIKIQKDQDMYAATGPTGHIKLMMERGRDTRVMSGPIGPSVPMRTGQTDHTSPQHGLTDPDLHCHTEMKVCIHVLSQTHHAN